MRHLEETSLVDIHAAKKIRLNELEFKSYISRRLVEARQLTELDYQQTRGYIYTFDGQNSHFKAGDYLLRGINQDVWIVPAAEFAQQFQPVAEDPQTGWGTYRYARAVEAARLPLEWPEPEMWVVGNSGFGNILLGAPGYYVTHRREAGPVGDEITDSLSLPSEWDVVEPIRFEADYRVETETESEEEAA
jgi:hypothetical protein